MTDATPDDGMIVPDEAPDAAADAAAPDAAPATDPAADPAALELQDELDSIRGTGEDLRG